MLIKGIDLADDLLRAQAAGNMVVFAGAGVSCPSPSSLPTFAGLTAKIGENAGVAKEDDEPDDRYLGRLKQNGINVHEAAARILVNSQTKPHELHRQLLQLFPSLDTMRWTPKTGPQVKMDFRWSAGQKKADYESQTQTA